jgi:outer membrane protein assembly factor BamB
MPVPPSGQVWFGPRALTPRRLFLIMAKNGFGMRGFKRFEFKKAIVVVAVLVMLLSCSCMGARGWPSGTVDGGTMYIGSMGGAIVALNAESGVRMWEWKAEKEEVGSFLSCGAGAGQFSAGQVYGGPLVVDGVAYFGAYDGKVYALDVEDGDELWSYQLDGTIVGGIAVANGTLYVGTSDGYLYALETEVEGMEGRLKEGFVPVETGDKVWAQPVVHDDTVYFGSLDHKLYAVDGATGESIWDEPFETGGGIGSPPVVVNGVVYIGSFDSKFYAVDAATKEEKWVFEAENWFWANPVYRDGIIYACSLDHKVYAIDAASGELASSWPGPFDAGSEIKSSPVIVDDVLVVASEFGKIYGLDIQSGSEEWDVDLEAKVGSALFGSDGFCHVNAQDGWLYTFNASTGRQEWKVNLVE